MSSTTHPPRLIAGSARSGTTWLLDALAKANRTGTLFEPLNPRGVHAAAGLDNRYLRATDEAPHARAFFDALFAGGYRNVWTLGRVHADALRPGKESARRLASEWIDLLGNLRRYAPAPRGTRLYKLIRANLMLSWLERRYGARIAFVIRHPAAVVASRLRRDWPWQPVLTGWLDDPVLVEDHLAAVAGRLHDLRSDVEGHTAVWAVQHRVALSAWREASFGVFFYEDLLAAKPAEWERLRSALALERLPAPALRERASQQSDRELAASPVTAETPPRWRSSLDAGALAAVERVLALFDLDLYSMEHDAPTGAAEAYRVPR